jgi:methylenetetrahydrofolate--tRNA-(uracil-5-)-methyltransferase
VQLERIEDSPNTAVSSAPIHIIGGGLAGSEAAYQIAKRGASVILHEMRPDVMTPAHKTDNMAELVCSNSLKSRETSNAHGLLKAELAACDSLILKIAIQNAIPGGKALVVDRSHFSQGITDSLLSNTNIRLIREKVDTIPSTGIFIIATGPLTSHELSTSIGSLTEAENLHFFDALSPIIESNTIDMAHAFFGSRYGSGDDDYLNCPLSREEYDKFYDALISGTRVNLKNFDKTPYFEGCLPIEVMAERGRNTLAFGPMKPVGLRDPKGGSDPFAVIQLRREDKEGTMYNMVGFQTKLTYPEQERIFRLIPALKNAMFFRHGSIHRNTFINAPAVLDGLQLRKDRRIFFAGQITGVEGYMESTAMGLLAGISALYYQQDRLFTAPDPTTCTGALYRYISTPRKNFQPMNINFGLLEGYDKRKKEFLVERSLSAIKSWQSEIEKDLKRK